MKTLFAAITGMVLSAGTAMADGFVCSTPDQDLVAKVYNNTQPEAGTRTAAVLILSNPSLQSGNKTIAVFRNASGTLASVGTSYDVKVDLRFAEISRPGEYLMGTRLGNVKKINLAVDHNYLYPMEAGETTSGVLTLTKRDGSEITQEVECERYLRN